MTKTRELNWVKFTGSADTIWNGVSVVRQVHKEDQFNPDGFNQYYSDGRLNVPMLSYGFGVGIPMNVKYRIKNPDLCCNKYQFFKEFFPTIIDGHIALYSRTGLETGDEEITFLRGIEDMVNLDFAEHRLRELALKEAAEYARKNKIPEIDDDTEDIYLSEQEKHIWDTIRFRRISGR